MYQLLTESKKNIQKYDISGTIGSISITDSNIIKNSLNVTNQCADESTFNLGAVYIGQLTCTFNNMNIPRNEWVGKEISLSVTVNNTETVPVGVFYVDSAEHTKGLTRVKAYDSMTKFDKPLENTATIDDTPFVVLTWICSQCGVSLGMTELEVESLPNGNETFFVSQLGDIETYRDILFWISQTLGGFATIDRNGELVIRVYHDTVDDTIDYDVRFNTSNYGDEIVSFSGFYWTNEQNGTQEYEHLTPDDGYSLNLGINPFLQGGLRANYIQGILNALSNISFNSCNVTIPFGIHYDLGDVLSFPNGQGSSTNKFCVLSYSWDYYGGYTMKSIAVPKTSKSKADKNITALMRNGESDKIRYYLISSIKDFDIDDGEKKDIIDIYFTAQKQTIVVFNVELHCEVETTVDDNDYYDAVAEFEYYYNNSYIEDFEPVETWQDGKHIKHLLYYFTISEAGAKRIQVKLGMTGGSVHIDMNNIKGAIYGQDLVASEDWDGIIRVEEEVNDFDLIDIDFENASDSVEMELL